MRPPMQAPALQPQHELIHHQQQQHQHQLQHQQQQQRQHQQLQQRQLQHHQHQETAAAAAAAAAANLANHQQRKSKQPRDRGPLVDSQLTFVGSPWSTTATKAKTTELAATFVTSQKQSQKQQQQQSQQLQQQQQHRQYQRRLPSSYADHDRHHDHHHDHDHDDGDSIQLLDLSNSPAHAHSHPAPFHAAAYQQRRAVAPSTARTRSNSLSFSDCGFSRSSSSEDGSYAACDHLRLFSPGGAGRASTATGTAAGCSDDPGENFVIHFPAGDIDTDIDVDPDADLTDANGDVLQLPLSETEPLLTHIGTSGAGAVAAERQRAICLSKNSGSLIFTRKDLSQHQQQQQQRSRNSGYAVSNNNGGSAAGQRQQPRSFRSAERGRKQQQQQQQQLLDPSQSHRYSLQLNYNNNNLISSSHSVSGFGKNHNNNNFCHAPRLPPPQQQQPPTATAAATRKQHAYSWYAPVYSALEEELEQDSRDSSPTHNLANTRKHLPHHYQPLRPSAQPDNETVALLEARNQINIQPQLHPQSQTQTSLHRSSRSHGQRGGGGGGGSGPVAATAAATAAQVPTSLPLPSLGGGPSSSELGVRDGDLGSGAQASSLGLAGGPLPRLRRWESFFKWVGIRPSSGRRAADDVNAATAAPTAPTESGAAPPCASPEITITRSPSDQNVVVLRHPAGRCPPPTRKRSPVAAGAAAAAGAGAANDKLASSGGLGSSTSSLNFVHQKLWNMMRREGSASSLNHVKSHSIVQYTGMRKCETVLALTRQSSLCSPVLGAGPGIIGGAATQHRTGSGIFSASGVEQIRPLNRLRNSLSTMNAGATCSRCSSILSLAASESRYSLSVAPGGFVSTGAASLSPASSLSPSALASGTASPTSSQQQLQQQQQQMPQTTFAPSTSSRKSSAGAGSVGSSSISPPSNVTTATFTPSTPTSTSTLTTTPTAGLLDGFPPPPAPAPALATSRPARSTPRPASQQQRQPITVTSLLSMSSSESAASSNGSSSSSEEDAGPIVVATAPAPAPPPTPLASSSVAPVPASAGVSSASSCASLTAKSQRRQQKLQRSQQEQEDHQQQQPPDAACPPSPAQPFETFTCKLCLVDVEAADEATALLQCGCQFCTECMKAYVEFEISEGAYEISCPDAQCPAQGIVTLPEIASLTTANLMKKHHRYRLNREIELDKSRTWCPRAGCETVCLVGPGLASGSGTDPSAPSTSTALGLTAATPATSGSAARDGGDAIAPFLCAVQCPSCKDEFCSACKKAWHPNVSCEENGRRLVADGRDDIGIPFDNDLIKCCPMCAVPIEKDEGCAQMMCKRCKHVFCWYCLASLDDDFLLRHYDKGPCKNKLGHSRASVVWHRAQVIGIFAGFGILLLVASPLLLLAAPCIICCKCRICSGSKVDEGDGELDEATALQS